MKIKSTCILIAMITLVAFCQAQEKIEKYCKISYNYEFFAKKITINLGSQEIDFRDSTEKKKLMEVKKLKNEVDMLDYMDKLGWQMISSWYNRDEIDFYFRKKFGADEIIPTTTNHQ